MDYPWYQVVRGKELEQGDILESCPVFLPRTDLAATEEGTLLFDEELRDVIIVSQSCDLVIGREKISEVLLCPLWRREQLLPPHIFPQRKGWKRRGAASYPGFSSSRHAVWQGLTVLSGLRTFPVFT